MTLIEWGVNFCYNNIFIAFTIQCRKNSLLIQIVVEIVWDNVDCWNEWMDLGLCVRHTRRFFCRGR